MGRLILLFSLPLLALSCIPTKTPEPGIPATPGPPAANGCTPLGKWDPTACKTKTGAANGCTAATQTTTAITCTTGKLVIIGSKNQANDQLTAITCTVATNMWFFDGPGGSDTQANYEAAFGTNLMVACRND